MKIKNMTSFNNNIVPNQFVIIKSTRVIFQSYDSIICVIDKKTRTIRISSKWDKSATTTRYLRYFLNEYSAHFFFDKKDIEKLISDHTIKIDNRINRK